MTTFFTTKKRRAEQLLWNALDQHLAALMPAGVVLAVSGGPDSRALLESVATWSKRLQGLVVVACIDHGVRAEARAEARYVYARAMRLGFHAHYESLVTTNSRTNEQDLRLNRYAILKSVAIKLGCKSIVTAHHRDDDNEGFIMALMGTGGGALGAAMAVEHNADGVTVCRPFLSLSKADLLAALTLNGITDYVRDRLDESRAGERAYVRHEILPELYKNVPHLQHRLQAFGVAQRDQAQIMNQAAASLITWHKAHANINCSRDTQSPLLSAAIWQVLKRFGSGRDLRSSQKTINNILNNIDKNIINKRFEFAGVSITSTRNGLVIRPVETKA